MDVITNPRVHDMDVSSASDVEGHPSDVFERGRQRPPARAFPARLDRPTRLAHLLRRSKASKGQDCSNEADLRRHLDWCRRYEESTHLLVVHVPAPSARQIAGARDIFRSSDSVVLRRVSRSLELRALLADRELDRVAVEHRVHERLGAKASFAWARFPDDAVTLDTLVDVAQARLGAQAQCDPSPRSAASNGRLRVAVAEEKYADA